MRSEPGRPFLAAVVQMTSTADEEENWRQAKRLIEKAAGLGAELVVTPENTNFLGPHDEKVRRAEPLDGPTCGRFAALADSLDLFLLLGSFHEACDEPAPEPGPGSGAEPGPEAGPESAPPPGRCCNTSVLFGQEGEILGVYRKIHLFDADLGPAAGFRESATVKPGREVVVAETPLARIGLSICYDLRFGELYRELVAQGAELVAIPSAFTAATGKAHWEVLVRARAIESQAYVLAAAQHGRHDDGGIRESHGQSLVVDPWGQIVAAVPDGPGVAVAEIDLERVRRVRAALPVARHRRL
ncbi:MAG: carbon-nitrogen hydrolase family protein [Thermoanaerobaculia bacterium]|nr:carbon-nitrogen hydrolase family protein [Thermoanaerobaculia bacterium]